MITDHVRGSFGARGCVRVERGKRPCSSCTINLLLQCPSKGVSPKEQNIEEEKKKVKERELEMTKDLTFVTLYLGNSISFKITIVTNYFYFYFYVIL
jgi:hypothetical protein